MVACRWRLNRLFLTFLFLFSALTGIDSFRAVAQNLPALNSNIAEEQDYTFAHGLHKDGLFPIASEQFDKFIKKYPQSVRIQDAQFLRADCLFQQEQFPAAAREFSIFVNQYPTSILSDNARFRLGETYSKLKRNRDAIESYKSILDQPRNSSLAGEAAYWIGEIYLKEET